MDGEKDRDEKFDGKASARLVEELRRSFSDGKTKGYDWRASQLKSLSRMLVEREDDIIGALREDLNKPATESFIHEIALLKEATSLALKELKRWMKPQKVSGSLATHPSSTEIVSEPLGLVLIIAAWNYPFLVSLDPLIGAVAAGNAVVLKPSEIAPASSSLMRRLVGEYLDPSSIRVVEGGVPETTALLEQKWDKICYTGSGNVGRVVLAAAAKHLTPVLLELGGKCPVVVDSNINLKVATKRIVVGKWGCNNGQTCAAPDYLITTRAFAPKLVEAMKKTLEVFYGKDPLESEDISRIVNASHFKRLSRLLDAEKVTDKIVIGGQRDEQALRIAPTVLLDVPEDSLMMTEEIFGPLLPIVTVEEIRQSIDFIISRPKPLAAYLFSSEKTLEDEFVSRISAGGMCINDTVVQVGNNNLPFGGVGESGMGNYHGKFSFDAFSHKKGVVRRSFAGEISARYPPYTPKKTQFVRALLNMDILGIIFALIGWHRA